MQPRIVATDLDGTLLRSDRTISDVTVDVLHQVRRAGATLVVVTARPFRYIRDVADRLEHSGLAICSNGALVYDLATERVIEKHALSPQIALEMVRRLRTVVPSLAYLIETAEGYAHEPAYQREAEFEALQVDAVEELVRTNAAIKLVGRDEGMDPDELVAIARDVLGNAVEVTHSGGPGLLEISAAGVSKATTLGAVCAERGVEAAGVVAFGDMPNDLPMLSWAGQAYAMANAHPAVLAAIADRAPSNDEDGVAVVLRRLFS